MAQLQAEPWWGREIVTAELDWLGGELCRRTGQPRTAAGTKGDQYHLSGAHRSQEWILNSRYATNRTYTVQAGLTAGQVRHVAGFDFTPGTPAAMVAQCRRLMGAMKAGVLEPVREFYGDVDGDRVVDGWNNLADRAATSDSSHLWHWHLSFDRRALHDRVLMGRIVAIVLGDDMSWTEILDNGRGATYPAKDWLMGTNEAAWLTLAETRAARAEQTAQAAADEIRDKATLAALEALKTSGGVDVTPAVNAIREVQAEARQRFTDLETALAAVTTERDRLAAQLKAEIRDTVADLAEGGAAAVRADANPA